MQRLTLRAARVNVGLTQKAAAKMLGVSNKSLSKWENGEIIPRADKIDRICELYKTQYDNIIFLPSDSLKAN